MTSLRSGAVLQFRLLRANPAQLIHLAVAPLMAAILLAVIVGAGRRDLATVGIAAPVLMTMWTQALFISGETVSDDRWFGTLEWRLAAPGSWVATTIGRVTLVAIVGSLALGESWIVAGAAFGIQLGVAAPGVLLGTVGLACLGSVGAGLCFAGLIARSRGARTLQNSLSYPVYVLAGLVMPIDQLPGWLAPIGKLIYLSWAADLLRESLSGLQAGWAERLLILGGLSVAMIVVGCLILGSVEKALRKSGSAALA